MQRKLWKNVELLILGEGVRAESFWDAEKNAAIDLNTVGVQDKRQVYLYRMCRKHYMFQSFKSVIDNFKKHGTSMNCKICQAFNTMLSLDDTQKASAYEQSVFDCLSHMKKDDWIVDARILLGNFGSADILFPALKLIVMVDGEGHFHDQHGKAVYQQEERDDAFNYEALDQGHKVLRLHYRDQAIFGSLLQNMLADCQSKQLKPYLCWSPAFHRAKESA